MKLFLDTSVLLGASESPLSASRELFQRARSNDWTLIATPFVLNEVACNLDQLSPHGVYDWKVLRQQLVVVADMPAFDQVMKVASARKNPVLFSALASTEALLTLDEARFASLMQTTFYGLVIVRPGIFLQQQRASGRLR